MTKEHYLKLITLLCLCCIASCNQLGTVSTSSAIPTTTIAGEEPIPTVLPPITPTVKMPGDNCANKYYPVVSGASWTYTGNNPVTGQFSFKRSITSKSANGFEDEDVWDGGTTRTGTWTCENGNLTALNQGGAATVSVPTSVSSPTFEAESVNSVGISIPAEIELDNSWNQAIHLTGKMTMAGGNMVMDVDNETTITCTPTSIESVTVPAGTFDAIKIVCPSTMTITIEKNTSSTFKSTSTIWYASGVGLVKIADVSEIGNVVIELTGYHIPVQ